MYLFLQTSAVGHGENQLGEIAQRRLHRASGVGFRAALGAERAAIFVIAIGIVVFESWLPDHACPRHAEGLKHSRLHQFFQRLTGHVFYYALQQKNALARVSIARPRLKVDIQFVIVGEGAQIGESRSVIEQHARRDLFVTLISARSRYFAYSGSGLGRYW